MSNMIKELYNSKYKNDLFRLLNKFFDDYIDKSEVVDLILRDNNDIDILNYLEKNKNLKIRIYSEDDRKKETMKAAYVKYLYDNILDIDKKKINKLLDIGCNTGKLTLELKKVFNLLSDDTYCIEIKSFTGIPIKSLKGFTFSYYDGENINFPDNYFDMITIFMGLHHAVNQEKLISEIYRVLNYNGILIIREHDSEDKLMEKLIILEHLIYTTIYEKIKPNIFYETNVSNYLSQNTLIDIMKSHGFKLIKFKDHVLKKNISSHNPTKYYYIGFIKKPDINKPINAPLIKKIRGFPESVNVNYDNIKFTMEAIYSISGREGSLFIANLIEKYMETANIVVTDATANIGSDSIEFGLRFKKVNSVEIDPINYEALVNNIKVYKLENKIDYYNDDIINIINNLNQDVIYIDPPWGGSKYKKKKCLNLYINKYEISTFYLKYINKAKLFVFKVPFNYDIDFFVKQIKDTIHIHNYLDENHEVIYKIIIVESFVYK